MAYILFFEVVENRLLIDDKIYERSLKDENNSN